MAEVIQGRLGFNLENNRYGLLVDDLWEHDGFHYGECLQVLVDEEWVDTRIEMAWGRNGGEWYLVGTPFMGDLEFIQAKIKR